MTKGRQLGDAMHALGPQRRGIQRAERKSAKPEVTDIGVLPRNLVIAYSLETKGAKDNKKEGLASTSLDIGSPISNISGNKLCRARIEKP